MPLAEAYVRGQEGGQVVKMYNAIHSIQMRKTKNQVHVSRLFIPHVQS